METRLAVLAVLCTPTLFAQSDWPGYGNDKGAQRYSPLTQINVTNVSTLIPAWTFSMKKDGQPFRPSQSIPLVVKGVMYVSWPFNHLAALVPETGVVIWEYTAKGDYPGKLGSMRSLEYWPGDKKSAPEIVFATEEGELCALDAGTGKPIPGFGNKGIVNLRTPEVMNGFPNMHLGISSAAGFRVIHKQDQDPKAPPESPRLYDHESGGSSNATISGWPCWQPPWGRLTAVNVNTGEIAWQVPFGSVSGIPDGIKTGGPNSGGGPISTAGGLIFIGAAKDRFFRAFNAMTGQELWRTRLEEIAQSVPITWQRSGNMQYVAIAAGSHLLTFKLPGQEKEK